MDKKITELSDRELLEKIAEDMQAARQLAESLTEQFGAIANNPKFSVIAKMLGLG
jgi:hypothetical protein